MREAGMVCWLAVAETMFAGKVVNGEADTGPWRRKRRPLRICGSRGSSDGGQSFALARWLAVDWPPWSFRAKPARFGSSDVFGLARAALFQAIALAVHLEDADVTGQPVAESAGQPLGSESLGPFVERHPGPIGPSA